MQESAISGFKMSVRRIERKIEHASAVVNGETLVDKRTGFNNFCTENYDFFDPFKVIQEKLIFEMLVSILHCKTMYCHQRILPSMFITSETERN